MPQSLTLVQRLEVVSEIFRATQPKRCSMATLSDRILGDARKLPEIFANKRSMTIRSYEKALQWLSDRWPDKVEWPSGIERPEPKPLEEIAK